MHGAARKTRSGAALRPGHEGGPRPPGASAAPGLRPRCGLHSVLAAVLPSAPMGLPSVPLLRNGKQTRKKKKSAKRASHAVQAAMSSCTAWLSVEPWWPSRLPCGARCAALTGQARAAGHVLLPRNARVCAILAQWDTTALFRRVCRRAARAVKPGGR
jgi:hypothetical protein